MRVDNKKIFCECGCGRSLLIFDKRGRERKYIKGHTNKNKVFSVEHRRKLSISHKGQIPVNIVDGSLIKCNIGNKYNLGKVLSREHRKNIGKGNKGKKLTEEQKLKISLGHRGKKKEWLCGENNPNWKGGITPLHNKIRGSIEYKLWQDSVFARDGYMCQKCLIIFKPYQLVAHHILNFAQYSELRTSIGNGIAFCRICHKKFHKIYGKRDNNDEQIIQFIINK